MKHLIICLLLSIATVACAQPDSPILKYYCDPCNNPCDTIAYDEPGVCEHCGMKRVAMNDDDVKRLKASITHRLKVAIFIHEGVELLDFAGPGEVFSSAGFEVFTVAPTEDPVLSQGFLKVTPRYSIANCPSPDIIVLPGGATNIPMGNEAVMAWLKKSVPNTVITMSVCTGAGLLSKAGFLDGKTATTFHDYIETLQAITPKATIVSDTRFVDNGMIITTAGVSAGIDGALHVVEKLNGRTAAKTVAEYMEYDKWKPGDGLLVAAPKTSKK